ncbi:unnamed protein product [Rhodiola kirilowii]
MRDFPSCFGENSVQVGDVSSSTSGRVPQNLVSCVYKCRLGRHSCLITLIWTKNLMGLGLCVSIDDASNQCLCKVDIKPWLFSKQKGCKTVDVGSSKIIIYWDLSCAKFGSSPEPVEGFYVGVVFNSDLVLLLGDMEKEACRKIKMNTNRVNSKSIFVARREHIFGKKTYVAKAQLSDKGLTHDVVIECGSLGVAESCLVIRIDNKTVMKVKHLQWKFRGNQTILVDGQAVEVYWDVHNWLYGNAMGNAVFMFQTCQSAEKLWDDSGSFGNELSSPWHYSRSRESDLQCVMFSLVLYAWKNE